MGQHPNNDAFLGPAATGDPVASSAADDLIRLEVLNALHWDLAVPRGRVKVEVRCGHVTLAGVVDRAYSRACAERDAFAMYHVTGVTNAIEIALRSPSS